MKEQSVPQHSRIAHKYHYMLECREATTHLSHHRNQSGTHYSLKNKKYSRCHLCILFYKIAIIFQYTNPLNED